MFCTNCGKEIPDNVGFCPYCGARIEAAGGQPAPDGQGKGSAAGSGSIPVTPKGGKSPVTFDSKKIIPVAAIAALVLILIIVIANRRPTLNLNKYTTIRFTGYDTVGYANAVIDDDAIQKKYGKTMVKALVKEWRKELKSGGELAQYWGNTEPNEQDASYMVEKLFYPDGSAYGSFDKASRLSNGDKVTFTWNLDGSGIIAEDPEKYLGVKIRYKDITKKVSGLEKADVFDPFDDIDVTFDGTAPEGSATINVKSQSQLGDGFHFRITSDNNGSLSNGDTITVSLENDYSDDVSQQVLEATGRIPSETEKEYTVEGLGEYVTRAADIPDDVLQKMQKECQDQMDADIARESDHSTDQLKGMTYLGSYVLSAKTDEYYNSNHIIYLVYRVSFEDYHESADNIYDEIYTYYTAYRFYDLMILPDGTASVDYSNINEVGDRIANNAKDFTWYYLGYEDLDTLFNKVVTSSVDSYTYDSNVEDDDTTYTTTMSYGVPADAQEYNGHYYQTFPVGRITWEDAKKRCEDKGGHLATITSQDEENFVEQKVNTNSYNYYWLGATDVDGSWQWVTREEFDYTNWCDGEPSGDDGSGHTEHYLNSFRDMTWNDAANDYYDIDGYICEWDSKVESDAAADDTKEAQ